MKTLDYLQLNASATDNVVKSLQQLLADFQVYYTNLRGFHWNIQGPDFFVLHSKCGGQDRRNSGTHSYPRRCACQQVQRLFENLQDQRGR